MREKEKDQKERSWQGLCVGLKSWHLLNRAAALGAKCCQPAPLAWICALPLSLFSAWHFHYLYSTLFFLLYISAQYHPNSNHWHLLPLNGRINEAGVKIFINLHIISVHLWLFKGILFAYNCSFFTFKWKMCARRRRRIRRCVPLRFFFRVERAIPITGQVSVHVLCSAGPRQQGARRTDQNLAAGKWPRKRRSLRSFPSFLHITSPLLLLFAPRLRR